MLKRDLTKPKVCGPNAKRYPRVKPDEPCSTYSGMRKEVKEIEAHPNDIQDSIYHLAVRLYKVANMIEKDEYTEARAELDSILTDLSRDFLDLKKLI